MAEETTEKKGMAKGAWVVMVCCWIFGITMAITQYKTMAVTSMMIADLNISATDAGMISGVFTFTGIILAFPAAFLIRKIGAKKALFISAIAAIIGTLIGFFSGSYGILIVSRIIEGIGLGLIGIIGPSVIAMWFPIEKRGAPMGLWSNWQMVGISLMFYLSVPLSNLYGSWRVLWIVSICACVIGFILAAVFIKEPPKEYNHADVADEGVKLTKTFAIGNAWIVGLAALAFGLSNSVVIQWIAPYWISVGAMDPLMAGSMTGAMFTIEIFGTIVSGIIVNKIRKRRLALVIDSLIYAVAFWIIFRATGTGGCIGAMVFYALIESFFCCGMWTLVSQAVPDPRLAPGAIALYTMFIDVGMWLGPVFAGMIIDAGTPAGMEPGTVAASFGPVAYFVVVAQVLAAVFWWVLKLYDENGQVVKI